MRGIVSGRVTAADLALAAAILDREADRCEEEADSLALRRVASSLAAQVDQRNARRRTS